MTADHEPVRTASGKVLTNEDLERLADEAEAGYDLSRAKPRVVPVGLDAHLATRVAAQSRARGVRMHVILDEAVRQYLGPEDE